MRSIIVAIAFSLVHLMSAEAASNAEKIIAGCRSDHAFGYKFGEVSGQLFGDSPDLNPLDSALALRRTYLSWQLFASDVSITTKDPIQGQVLVTEIHNAAVNSGRFYSRAQDGDQSAISYVSADGALNLTIVASKEKISVSCLNSALQEVSLNEFRGETRLTSKPSFPSFSMPQTPSKTVCKDSGDRKSIIATSRDTMKRALEYTQALNAFEVGLNRWYNQQLRDNSDFSRSNSKEIAKQIRSDPEVQTAFKEMTDNISTMTKSLIISSEALSSGDEERACASSLDALAHIRALHAASIKPWRRWEILYREEAARRGITLE